MEPKKSINAMSVTVLLSSDGVYTIINKFMIMRVIQADATFSIIRNSVHMKLLDANSYTRSQKCVISRRIANSTNFNSDIHNRKIVKSRNTVTVILYFIRRTGMSLLEGNTLLF